MILKRCVGTPTLPIPTVVFWFSKIVPVTTNTVPILTAQFRVAVSSLSQIPALKEWFCGTMFESKKDWLI
jgi:hypothetical protein